MVMYVNRIPKIKQNLVPKQTKTFLKLKLHSDDAFLFRAQNDQLAGLLCERLQVQVLLKCY